MSIVLILISYSVIVHKKSNAQQFDIDLFKSFYKRPGILTIPYPEDNLHSEAKHDLGKKLFFDPRLSDIEVMSCATCHHPGFHWTDGLKISKGQEMKEVLRNTPTIINLAWDKHFFRDGRADTLERQAETAMTSKDEMNMTPEMVAQVLSEIPGYRDDFVKAFPGDGEMNIKNVVKAIATFERKLISEKAPFDKWVEGDEKAVSESAKRGFVIFNTKGKCASCHSGWRFLNAEFYDVGIEDGDIGRGEEVPEDPTMQHAFKVVSLRNIPETGPYMHNGSIKTLEEVIEFFDRGGDAKRKNVAIEPLGLTREEKQDLQEFLLSLTSVDETVTAPVLPRRYRATGDKK